MIIEKGGQLFSVNMQDRRAVTRMVAELTTNEAIDRETIPGSGGLTVGAAKAELREIDSTLRRSEAQTGFGGPTAMSFSERTRLEARMKTLKRWIEEARSRQHHASNRQQPRRPAEPAYMPQPRPYWEQDAAPAKQPDEQARNTARPTSPPKGTAVRLSDGGVYMPSRRPDGSYPAPAAARNAGRPDVLRHVEGVVTNADGKLYRKVVEYIPDPNAPPLRPNTYSPDSCGRMRRRS